jgi:hypothetical protein
MIFSTWRSKVEKSCQHEWRNNHVGTSIRRSALATHPFQRTFPAHPQLFFGPAARHDGGSSKVLSACLASCRADITGAMLEASDAVWERRQLACADACFRRASSMELSFFYGRCSFFYGSGSPSHRRFFFAGVSWLICAMVSGDHSCTIERGLCEGLRFLCVLRAELCFIIVCVCSLEARCMWFVCIYT